MLPEEPEFAEREPSINDLIDDPLRCDLLLPELKEGNEGVERVEGKLGSAGLDDPVERREPKLFVLLELVLLVRLELKLRLPLERLVPKLLELLERLEPKLLELLERLEPKLRLPPERLEPKLELERPELKPELLRLELDPEKRGGLAVAKSATTRPPMARVSTAMEHREIGLDMTPPLVNRSFGKRNIPLEPCCRLHTQRRTQSELYCPLFP